jgi:hypothetical protein
MRSRIDSWIDELECWRRVEGAKMSMSRWRRSHQKGVESSMDEQLVEEMTMACMIKAWRLQKAGLLQEWRKCCQVVRKSGGSWS